MVGCAEFWPQCLDLIEEGQRPAVLGSAYLSLTCQGLASLRGNPENPLPYPSGEWIECIAWEPVLTTVEGDSKEEEEFLLELLVQ